MIDFITNNISFENGFVTGAIMLGILWIVFYDFYHILFTAIFSWFKKG